MVAIKGTASFKHHHD